MGVDSAPEQNKLNLNYVNVDTNGNVVPDMETNLIPWTNALQFFTNAADRMLRDYSQEWLVESPSNYRGDLRQLHQHQHVDRIPRTCPCRLASRTFRCW